MNQVKVLKQDEFYFRILVTNESDYFGLDGLIELSGKLPSTIKTLGVKVANPICKIYCMTDNHSDYMGIESRLSVKTEMM
ncbi:hypothetical protein [Winogradskyella sp. SM1960]|uniref:hypothetical protein n=1 Tax=Winogradskyella sp. SM1960 TaxID=2865955 RepID=UPI001CD2A90A|nr:hypothetical protein [Winogradskyella sp. SM1960]